MTAVNKFIYACNSTLSSRTFRFRVKRENLIFTVTVGNIIFLCFISQKLQSLAYGWITSINKLDYCGLRSFSHQEQVSSTFRNFVCYVRDKSYVQDIAYFCPLSLSKGCMMGLIQHIFNPRYTRDTANINEHHNVSILKIMGCYVRDNEIRQKMSSYINSSTDPKC